MRILYDASRLMSRADRSAPTGVDRVCLAYAEWLLSRPDVVTIPVRGRKNRLVAVDTEWFRRFVGELRARWNGAADASGDPAHEARLLAALTASVRPNLSVISPPPAPSLKKPADRSRVLKQFFRSRHVVAPPAADLYLNVGHTTLHEPTALLELEAAGVERVVLLHDLIPITHPEFCRAGDGAKHHARVANTLRYASRVIVNSASTGDELRAFASREGLPQPPVHVAHLGLEPVFIDGDIVETTRPYFVHVGTIEARKNLALLLTVWRRLEERLGERAPSLVLVGRYGWENEAVLDHLERSPNLQGVVHQASNLSDVLLARLMRGARAVLAPSSVEGFDLPAVEARAMGLSLFASDIPAHRELTPNAVLIDPLDGLGWLAAVERAAQERPATPTPQSAPSWAGHFHIVAEAIGLSPASPLAGVSKDL